ncbi:DUF3150 domain-containing protein [Paucidesulfovibrio longus]|uniref:DUF3150 domain-containing protein n=1 Tax=Paucidesulfovibrio longus TaxID=889 RepID=UPI0003B62BA7|nr:DUF3150 domain-containing protein [Paucidesulfovibrio longus]
MSTDIKVLKELVAVRLDVNIWSARKKLTPSDFGTADLPPEKLASLGSKRICDPAELRIFGSLKAKAVTMLDRIGVRFLGGWAIPEASVQKVQAGLQAIADDYQSAKEAFLHRYDDAVHGWILDNPGWESIIASSLVSADHVRSRLGFSWQLFRVAPPRKDRNAEAQVGLHEEVSGLGTRLFGEVAKAARDAWHKSYAGRTEITRKALSPLRTLQRKLCGLSFVEPRVAPVAELIETALARVPESGRIDGAELVMLQGLVCLLGNPDLLVEHGKKVMDGRSPDAILQGLLKAPRLPALDAAVPVSDMDSGLDSRLENDEEFAPELPLGRAPFSPAHAPVASPVVHLDSLGLW